jgi:uncharacterized protein YydD (DUF2326 family)
MIRRISANKKSFRPIEFSPGFNLVLAERTADSTDRDSRNGLGKSLLVEIFHFCLGARGTKGRGVVVDTLQDWVFRLDLIQGERPLAFSRAVADDERKWLYVESAFDDWSVKPTVHEGRARFNTAAQNKLLGRFLFALTEEIEETKWGPTYRSLVSYVMRRGPDGFLDPFTHDRNQQEWDKQVNVAYHLDLNWRDAAEFQELRAQKKVIDQLTKAMKEGSLPSYLGSEGALEAERVRLNTEIGRRVERLATFHVRDDYRDIEDEAGRIAEQAHRLVNENIRDRRYIDLYSSRLEVELDAVITGVEVEKLFEEAQVTLPDQVRHHLTDLEDEAGRIAEQAHRLVNENIRDRRYIDLYSSRLEVELDAVITGVEVEKLFEEAQVTLPDQVRHHLTDLKSFHDAVIENRRAYLVDEIARLEATILARDHTIEQLDSRKAELMTVLESTGALEEYTRLQELLVELRGRLHDVEARLARLKEVTQAKEEWERRRSDLLRRARTRYGELRAERDRAIAYFNANTEALYETPGRLIIDVSEKGFEFDVDIDRSDSHGVGNMKIFCFDLMLMQLWSHRPNGPGVLVHDSALFDGVDERQVAAALQLAHKECERLGFQYICTMNSDDLPRAELGEDSPVLKSIAIELHDEDPSGMLLGIAF